MTYIPVSLAKISFCFYKHCVYTAFKISFFRYTTRIIVRQRLKLDGILTGLYRVLFLAILWSCLVFSKFL